MMNLSFNLLVLKVLSYKKPQLLLHILWPQDRVQDREYKLYDLRSARRIQLI